MGPPSYMRSVVDRNVVMRRMTIVHNEYLELYVVYAVRIVTYEG